MLYLQACSLKGTFRVGVQAFVFFLVPVHPVKAAGTPLNSLLFNVQVILLTTAGSGMLCYKAFARYVGRGAAQMLYSGQIENIEIFRYFFSNKIFLYLFLGIASLTFLTQFIFVFIKS